jgi:hypothetical protein|tara:strand:- start:75 stop:233 length:159 start_codon:yes stop_codon:yes gene_type:complete
MNYNDYYEVYYNSTDQVIPSGWGVVQNETDGIFTVKMESTGVLVQAYDHELS